MYFLVDKSLGMGGGKIAAQVGHAAMELTRRAEPELQTYLRNSKVVLYVDNVYEMCQYMDLAEDHGLMTTVINDVFDGHHKPTVIGIGPVTPEHYKLFKELSLVP